MITDQQLRVLVSLAIFKVNTNRALGQCESMEILELLESLADKFGIDHNLGKVIEASTEGKYREGRIG
jgi:hypothetical protein